MEVKRKQALEPETWVQILALLLANRVTLSKSTPEPQFPHLWNGNDDKNSSLTGSWCRLDEMMRGTSLVCGAWGRALLGDHKS